MGGASRDGEHLETGRRHADREGTDEDGKEDGDDVAAIVVVGLFAHEFGAVPECEGECAEL